MVYAYSPSTQVAEASGSPRLRSAWSQWVPGHPGLHIETLSPKNKKTQDKKTRHNPTFHETGAKKKKVNDRKAACSRWHVVKVRSTRDTAQLVWSLPSMHKAPRLIHGGHAGHVAQLAILALRRWGQQFKVILVWGQPGIHDTPKQKTQPFVKQVEKGCRGREKAKFHRRVAAVQTGRKEASELPGPTSLHAELRVDVEDFACWNV